MKYAPCERLATRIRPKMSEKPAASMNSTPPMARLFMLWISQQFMRAEAGAGRGLLEVLGGGVVAGVDRRRQEVGLLVGPELRDLRVRLHDRVNQLAPGAFDLAHLDVHDRVAQGVERHLAARIFGELHLAQG